jgi:hypothetical protein
LRNLHFRNDIKEFTITGLINLLPQYSNGLRGRSFITPYSFIGFGFFAHNPQARDVAAINPATGNILLGGWTNLRDKQTSGQGINPTYPKAYSLIQPVFPVGIGVKIKINEKFNLGIEGGLRITLSDYLDDVGKSDYPDPADLVAVSPLSVAFANRAGEDYSAFTGASRIAQFADIATNQLSLATPGTPSSNGLAVFGFPISERGKQKLDSYFTTQITLNYIISSQVKCPPIK